MEPRNPDFRTAVETVFKTAPFVQHLGVVLTDCGPGWCETVLDIAESQRQQNGFVHGGVLATLADHTAGACATTLIAANEMVLTVEFKVHFLRPAQADRVRCRAEALRAGRRISAIESSVFAADGEANALVAKAMVTIAVVPRGNGQNTVES